ncbi:hypothetical protein TNCV_3385751 [Trichonephila clavipes]|uniref:Uncharacterized protein n=1 Tax=Trichonephila clavipes TaxID=2585209 RepID=A0A8X6VQY3_TRICX|nr:hypothetical protein TNCV_3385751 [Trichonephila clavipes]
MITPIESSSMISSYPFSSFTPIESFKFTSLSNSSVKPSSAPTRSQNLKGRAGARRSKKVIIKKLIDVKMAQHRPKESSSVEYTTTEKDMIAYNVQED